MYENMIGKFTDKYEEINAARPLVSWVELYYLDEKKRSIARANLKFGDNLCLWIFSPNTGAYFMVDEVDDNPAIRRIINHGNAFLVPNEEHDRRVRAGMAIVGAKYGIEDIDYYRHYLPLMERILALEVEENLRKSERSEAEILALKREIKEILAR
jgi:hypothetical protein